MRAKATTIKGHVRCEGIIIDETQKTLTIRTKNREKKVIKKDNNFEIELPENEKVLVNGKLLYGRPEERIKKKLPKKWSVLR